MYENSVLTSHETYFISATEPSRLMLLKETAALYYENHGKRTNSFCGQIAESSILKHMVHRLNTGVWGVNQASGYKDMWEGGDMAPRILNLGTRWRQTASFMLWPLYHRYLPLPHALAENRNLIPRSSNP
jgi:hypothetical protein